MYERLEKLREEVSRWRRKLEYDKGKLKEAEDKLTAAENAQIIADVGALNLTPEQLAEFLKQAKSGGGAIQSTPQVTRYEETEEEEDEEK